MSSFTSEPILKLIDDNLWEVQEPFRYYLNDNMKGEYIEVPTGYVTNFASIPRPFKWLINPAHPHYAKAAIVHDGLVGEFDQPELWICIDSVPVEKMNTRKASWKEAAAIFKNGCKVLKCPSWKYQSMYLAIRLYGFLTRRV